MNSVLVTVLLKVRVFKARIYNGILPFIAYKLDKLAHEVDRLFDGIESQLECLCLLYTAVGYINQVLLYIVVYVVVIYPERWFLFVEPKVLSLLERKVELILILVLITTAFFKVV